MILFYSNHCTSSKLLIDNIKRYNALEYFKLVNVEQYLAHGKKLPPQIHSVPAIMFKETKSLIFGKQVFDYLLLPGKGFLLNLPSKKTENSMEQGFTPSENVGEPSAFSLHAGIGAGDSFSFIEETSVDTQKGYIWCSLDEHIKIPTPEDASANLEKGEKSCKKDLPDISALRSQRELDLQNTLGSQAQAVPMTPR